MPTASPRTYRQGRFFTGLDRVAHDGDLAKVTSRYPPQLPGSTGSRFVVVKAPASAKYVSLHGEASDSKGTTVKATIVRAYAVGS